MTSHCSITYFFIRRGGLPCFRRLRRNRPETVSHGLRLGFGRCRGAAGRLAIHLAPPHRRLRRGPSPHTAGIHHDLARKLLGLDGVEWSVVDQHDDDVRRQRRIDIHLAHAMRAVEFVRQAINERLDQQELDLRARQLQFGGQIFDDLDRRALAQVVDVGLVGEAEAGDRADAGRPAILARTSRTTWRGRPLLIQRASRISRALSPSAETMNHGSTAMQWPPTPGPGCRMLTRGWWLASAISSHTSMPKSLADLGQLVGERDVDVAEGVLASACTARPCARR